jgi:hypothetical protein
MGTFKQGILGSFSGKVGTVTGSTWKGIPVMKGRTGRKRSSVSEEQLNQQAKFKRVTQFLRSMSELLNVSFARFATNMTGLNSALSYNIKNAVTGEYPNYSIDYSKVLVSRGDLANEGDASAAAGTDQVVFTWTDTSGEGSASAGDKAVLVVYCEALNKTVYKINGSTRSAGTATVAVPRFKGQVVQTWLAFKKVKGNEVSDSRYTGQLTIA